MSAVIEDRVPVTLDHFSKGAWTAKCLQMRILRSRLHDIGCQRDRRPGVVFRLECDNRSPSVRLALPHADRMLYELAQRLLGQASALNPVGEFAGARSSDHIEQALAAAGDDRELGIPQMIVRAVRFIRPRSRAVLERLEVRASDLPPEKLEGASVLFFLST